MSKFDVLDRPPRKRVNFYCSECKKYFDTYLRDDMTGNYTVECPSCKHHHYRKVVSGEVTSDRFSSQCFCGKCMDCNKKQKLSNGIIIGLTASLRDKA